VLIAEKNGRKIKLTAINALKKEKLEEIQRSSPKKRKN
jgi:hypothetical protein